MTAGSFFQNSGGWTVANFIELGLLLHKVRDDLPENYVWSSSYDIRESFIDAVLPSDDYRWMRRLVRLHPPDVVFAAMEKIGIDVLEASWRLGGSAAIEKLLEPLRTLQPTGPLAHMLVKQSGDP